MSFELRCENVQVRNALGLGFRNGKGLHWVFVTDIKGAFIGRDDLVMRSVVCSLR